MNRTRPHKPDGLNGRSLSGPCSLNRTAASAGPLQCASSLIATALPLANFSMGTTCQRFTRLTTLLLTPRAFNMQPQGQLRAVYHCLCYSRLWPLYSKHAHCQSQRPCICLQQLPSAWVTYELPRYLRQSSLERAD